MTAAPIQKGDKVRRLDPTSRSHHMVGTVAHVGLDHIVVQWDVPKPKGTANASTLQLKREGKGWERVAHRGHGGPTP